MQNAVLIKGKLITPTQVQLDEPVASVGTEVDVIVRTLQSSPSEEDESVFHFLRSLPEGTRDRADIDRQIREERDAWGDH